MKMKISAISLMELIFECRLDMQPPLPALVWSFTFWSGLTWVKPALVSLPKTTNGPKCTCMVDRCIQREQVAQTPPRLAHCLKITIHAVILPNQERVKMRQRLAGHFSAVFFYLGKWNKNFLLSLEKLLLVSFLLKPKIFPNITGE